MTAADLNFGDLLDAVALVRADQPAVIQGDLVRSWRDFDQRSNRLARRLLALGLAPGAKVAFYLRNSPAYLELLAACFKARLVHVNVNYRYVRDELRHVIDNADAEALVYDSDFAGEVDALRPLLRQCPVLVESGLCQDSADVLALEPMCSTGDGSPLAVRRSGDDLYFMYTGGTTGKPKAVMWPHSARIEVLDMARGATAAEHAEAVAAAGTWPVVLPACPLMHSTGFSTAVSALCAGGAVVLLPGAQFDAVACLDAIDQHQVSLVALVGDAFSVPIIDALRAAPGRWQLGSVTTLSSAGAMWSDGNKRELLEHFSAATVRDSLGSSEGSRLAGSELRRGEPGSTGSFHLGPNAKVFNEAFDEVQPGSGEQGMIATCGPIPLGYYKDEVRTRETFPTVAGVRWSVPGDWCTLAADGSIQLLGRGSGCINTGGEKVFPEEVEEALKTHPQIVDAAVFGLPDPRWGQAVMAVVQMRSGSGPDQAQIRTHLAPMLAAYKCPKQLVAVTLSFRAANGKMDYPRAKILFQEATGAAL